MTNIPFGLFPRRVTLAVEETLCWPSWDKDRMIVIQEGQLSHGRGSPYAHDLDICDLIRKMHGCGTSLAGQLGSALQQAQAQQNAAVPLHVALSQQQVYQKKP